MSKEDILKNLYKVWGTKPIDHMFQDEAIQFYADLAIAEIPAYEYRNYARSQVKGVADRQKAKEIAYRVQNKRDSGDSRTFAEVLQEELDKAKRGDK